MQPHRVFPNLLEPTSLAEVSEWTVQTESLRRSNMSFVFPFLYPCFQTQKWNLETGFFWNILCCFITPQVFFWARDRKFQWPSRAFFPWYRSSTVPHCPSPPGSRCPVYAIFVHHPCLACAWTKQRVAEDHPDLCWTYPHISLAHMIARNVSNTVIFMMSSI